MAKMTPEQLAKSGTEHSHQRALFCWLALNTANHPDFRWTFAIPNGGVRDRITAGKLKAEGVKAGVPDLCCPIRCREFSGLFIEMKKPKQGVVASAQSDWIDKLRMEGFAGAVCYGWLEARDTFKWYFDFSDDVIE